MSRQGYLELRSGDTGHDTEDGYENLARPRSSGRWIQRLTVLLLLVVSNAVTAIYFQSRAVHGCHPQDPSPVLKRVDLPFTRQQIDAALIPNTSIPRHIYRQSPSKDVDAAWDRVSRNGFFAISAEELVQLGKDPIFSIPTDEEWGFPADSYMMHIDVFHQIHCLNALRKGLITNYQYYWGARWGLEPPATFANHLNHCVDILLQNLMCDADVEPVTYVWHEDQPMPYPDFGVYKQCRDFDRLLEWHDANQIPDMHAKWTAYKKPEGAVQMPPVPGFQDYIAGIMTGRKYGVAIAPLEGLPPQCRAGD